MESPCGTICASAHADMQDLPNNLANSPTNPPRALPFPPHITTIKKGSSQTSLGTAFFPVDMIANGRRPFAAAVAVAAT